MMYQFNVWNIYLLERRWILSHRGSVLRHNYQTLPFFGEKRDRFSRERSTTLCAYWTSNHGSSDLRFAGNRSQAWGKRQKKIIIRSVPLQVIQLTTSASKPFLRLQNLCITSSPTISFFPESSSYPELARRKTAFKFPVEEQLGNCITIRSERPFFKARDWKKVTEFSFLVYKLNYYPLLCDLNKLVYACRWDNFAFVSKPRNRFHLLRFTKNKNVSITAHHARLPLCFPWVTWFHSWLHRIISKSSSDAVIQWLQIDHTSLMTITSLFCR